MHSNPPPIFTSTGTAIYYQGPDLREGPLPAVIFLALSAEASLYVDSFNQTAVRLAKQGVRVFSWDLPFHHKQADPKEAIYQWAVEFARDPHFLSRFIETSQRHIDELIAQQLIIPSKLAIAGLSRGAFIATHLAAQDSRLEIVLGFAPLTQPQLIDPSITTSASSYEQVSLITLAEHLIHKRIRFYIGNHDTRVGTEACFNFIQTVTQQAIAKGVRSPQTELIIYPCIGYKGHGTPPNIFYEGSHWIQNQLLSPLAS